MKIMRQSLLLVASMLIANTTFCPTISGTDEEIVVPNNVSIPKQTAVGTVAALPLSFVAPGSYSLLTLGISVVSSWGAIYCRVKGNSYYDHARSIKNNFNAEDEIKSYTLWGSGVHVLGYISSAIAICSGIKFLVNAPAMKDPIQTMDIIASKIATPITFGKFDRAFCQKYHVGAGAMLLFANATTSTIEDKVVNTKLGKKFSKRMKELARIEDLN